MSHIVYSESVISDDGRLIQLWADTKVSEHTRRAYATEISRFLNFVRKPVAHVTLADLQAYAGSLGQGSLRPASQNRAISAIKSLLSFGQETGYLTYNAGAAMKLRPDRDELAERILDSGEIVQLIEAAPEGRDRVLLRLLYVSGIRVSEACDLRWRDAVERQPGGQITVFGKGGKTRAVLLKQNIWQQLLAIRKGAPSEAAIFRSRKGGGPLDPSQMRRIVYAAAKKAGIGRSVSPHWLRHAHASHALDGSAPIHLVQATLGHASVATTSRYLHARPTESSSFYLPD
jgi:integrase/recombinase XerD